MPPKTKTQNLVTRVLQSPPSHFRKCLSLSILLIALINFTIIFLFLHPQHSVDSEWFHLDTGGLLQLMSNQSSLPPIIISEPTKRPGIGSRHFRSVAHKHNVSNDCHQVASEASLEEWKNGRTTICSIDTPHTKGWFHQENNTILVEEYVLKSWEYEPTFVRYQNVEGYWGRDLLPLSCPPGTTLRHEHLGRITQVKPPWLGPAKATTTERNESQITEVDSTVIQVKLFEQHNPYERFHAMLNAAMVMRMLHIENPQIVLVLGDTKSVTENTLDMWKSFSSFTSDPIVVDTATPRPKNETIKRFRDLIHLSSSGTSMIVTVSRAFRGRGRDHHCKSSLFRDMIHWMAMNYNIELNPVTDLSTTKSKNKVSQIVWSSRKPYCCVNHKYVSVKRSWNDEEKLIATVGEYLGSDYNITSVNFGQLSTRQSIQVVSEADIMVGVHGAGLIWSAFLPIHGGLLEVFGGDRSKINRHYHNVASEFIIIFVLTQ